MNTSVIAASLGIIAFSITVATTGWSISFSRYDQKPLPLDFLAQQARPARKAKAILLLIVTLALAAALFMEYYDAVKSIKPIILPLGASASLGCVFVARYFNRIRALEAIIRISRPDLYSMIKDRNG